MALPGFIRAPLRALPTAVTLAALVAGALSLYASFQAVESVNPETWRLRGALLIMLALILDGLDGNLARWLKAESTLGAELDTFVDLTAFGVAPALLLYTLADGFSVPLRVGLGTALVASGGWRLARFKTIDPHRGQRGFLGLPITVCASLVALAQILAMRAPANWGALKPTLSEGPAAGLLLAVVAVLAVLQVSHLHFPKPSKHPLFFGPGVALVLFLFAPIPALSAGAALAGIVFILLYVAVSPFLNKPAPPAHGHS